MNSYIAELINGERQNKQERIFAEKRERLQSFSEEEKARILKELEDEVDQNEAKFLF